MNFQIIYLIRLIDWLKECYELKQIKDQQLNNYWKIHFFKLRNKILKILKKRKANKFLYLNEYILINKKGKIKIKINLKIEIKNKTKIKKKSTFKPIINIMQKTAKKIKKIK